MSLGNEYLKIVQNRFNSIKELGDKTINQLSEEDIHWKLNKTSNSIAIIIKHLNGHMISRWSYFLSSDGEEASRKRDQEFEIDILTEKEMKTLWESGWNKLFDTLSELKTQDLLKNIPIRGNNHVVLEAIETQVSHYAYHVGQIVYIGKQLKGESWKTLSIAKDESEEYYKKARNVHFLK